MFLCLDSNQKSQGVPLYPDNTATLFTCSLPEHFRLNALGRGQGRWHLGLTDIALPAMKKGRKWDSIYVCCSACEVSCVGQSYKPVVASFSLGEIKRNNFVRFPSVHFVPLRVNNLSEITVEICGSNDDSLE